MSDNEQRVYSDYELIELFQMLLRSQIREGSINSIEELHCLLRHVEQAIAAGPSDDAEISQYANLAVQGPISPMDQSPRPDEADETSSEEPVAWRWRLKYEHRDIWTDWYVTERRRDYGGPNLRIEEQPLYPMVRAVMTNETKIPGLKSGHQMITPTCRDNRGTTPAFIEATERLQKLYDNYARSPGSDDVTWHLVLVREEATE